MEPEDWHRLNDDTGALVGPDGTSRVASTRRYDERGGLRRPLAVHQADVERTVPRNADGTVRRHADPRDGEWFGLLNDGGPAADPTRGLNCGDAVLSFFSTYVQGEPLVAAPRTFDAYADGDPDRPRGAERDVVARIERALGGSMQGLCPDVHDADPLQAQQAIEHAYTNLENHLLNVGAGAMAAIVTETADGRSHAWTAVNQDGRILWLDPQNGWFSSLGPLQFHSGQHSPGNVVLMDAAVVDADGRYAPLPYHSAAPYSTVEPEGPYTGRPDAEVLADTDAITRPGETPEQAADRAELAASEMRLREVLLRYEQLGDTPPAFDIAANDALYETDGAHTQTRHGPTVPLERSHPGRTIQGRIYGDDPWDGPANFSFRWRDAATMNRIVNQLVRENWDDIRSDLAVAGRFKRMFWVGQDVGEGYVNKGYGGVGPREAAYMRAQAVRLVVSLVPGADPARCFIVTTFPDVLGPQ